MVFDRSILLLDGFRDLDLSRNIGNKQPDLCI